MKYRDRLYSDYSTHFGGDLKEDDRVAFAIFDSIYPPIPQKEGAVLDLASGQGGWLRWINSKGCGNLHGVDLSEHDLNLTNLPQASLHRANLFDYLNSEGRAFDLIHAKDVVEHMTKDEIVEFFTACRRRLSPGGQLWISTFNALAPMAAQTWVGDFTHETAFSPTSIAQVMRACGFRQVEVRCVHPTPPTLKGRVRKLLFAPLAVFSSITARLRYGGVGDFSCAPTLLAFAVKDES